MTALLADTLVERRPHVHADRLQRSPDRCSPSSSKNESSVAVSLVGAADIAAARCPGPALHAQESANPGAARVLRTPWDRTL